MPVARPLTDLVHPSWAQALAPVEADVTRDGRLPARRGRRGPRLPARRRPRAAGVRPAAGRRPGAHRRPGPLPDPRPPGRAVVLGRARRAAGAAQPAEHLPGAGDRPRPADPGIGRPHAVVRAGRDAAQPGADRAPGKPRPATSGKGLGSRHGQAISALVARGGPLVAILWGRRRAVPGADARRRAAHRERPPLTAVGAVAASSARARSAAPTTCSPSRAPHPSTGA